jgi:hypothetical protein
MRTFVGESLQKIMQKLAWIEIIVKFKKGKFRFSPSHQCMWYSFTVSKNILGEKFQWPVVETIFTIRKLYLGTIA